MTYITEKLGLNENQETWKIYNDYEDKILKIPEKN